MGCRTPRPRSGVQELSFIAVLLLAACSKAPAPAAPATETSPAPDVATASTEPASPPEGTPIPAPEPPVSQLARLMQMLDRDGDGRASRAEHADQAGKMFDTMDADHDARVTADEMDVVRRGLHGEAASDSATAIAKVDLDGNGVLSVDEHATATRVVFERMDTDHDFYLTLQEMETANASGAAR